MNWHAVYILIFKKKKKKYKERTNEKEEQLVFYHTAGTQPYFEIRNVIKTAVVQKVFFLSQGKQTFSAKLTKKIIRKK